jgi:hypothetical protein
MDQRVHVGTTTVRLAEEADRTLAMLRKQAGLSISEVLKRGLIVCRTSAVMRRA